MWSNQGTGSYSSENSLLKSLKNKLMTRYEADWKRVISSNDGKLVSYKLFKSDFCLENYLLCGRFSDRRSFSKLRTSSHKLHIESGRHKRPVVPREDRCCNFCNSLEIENEYSS